MRSGLRELARPLLSAPSAAADPAALLGIRDWTSYLLARRWLSREAYEAAESDARHAAVSLLSNGLTYPLTLGHAWVGLGRPKRVTVVGARAEATMPPQMWHEACVLAGGSPLAVHLIGPAAIGPRESTTGRLTITVAGTVGGDGDAAEKRRGQLFHESAMGRALLSGSAAEAEIPDAFALFNPGFGEPGWADAWEPTVRALLAAKRPVLLSALSAADAARDAAFWARLAGAAPTWRSLHDGDAPRGVSYVDNPWRSLLAADGTARSADGDDDNGANRVVALLQPTT